jgi:hypothetical protein
LKRELYFVDCAARVREIVDNKTQDEHDGSATLGVGYFRVEDSPGDAGVSLHIVPSLLRPHFFSKVGRGLISPYSQEILYFGEAAFSVCRWLMLGLQSGPISQDDVASSLKGAWPELKGCRLFPEAVEVLLRALQKRVLDLRASQVVVLIDFDVLEHFFTGWLGPVVIPRNDLIFEVVSWFSEDWLHPNTVLVCDKGSDFEEMVHAARRVRRQTLISDDIVFRF